MALTAEEAAEDAETAVAEAAGGGVDLDDAVVDNCAVCLTPMHAVESVATLDECRHRFHAQCIISVLRRRALGGRCPICRGLSAADEEEENAGAAGGGEEESAASVAWRAGISNAEVQQQQQLVQQHQQTEEEDGGGESSDDDSEFELQMRRYGRGEGEEEKERGREVISVDDSSDGEDCGGGGDVDDSEGGSEGGSEGSSGSGGGSGGGGGGTANVTCMNRTCPWLAEGKGKWRSHVGRGPLRDRWRGGKPCAKCGAICHVGRFSS